MPQAPPAAPAQAAPAPGAPDAAPIPRRTPMPSDADLRREFDSFLNRAGQDTAGLSADDRAALFQEYLAWRSRNLDRTTP